jgi:hypothetical protein
MMPTKRSKKEGTEFLSPTSYIAREVETEIRQKELYIEGQETELLGRQHLRKRQENLFTILVYAFPISVAFTLIVVLLDGLHIANLDIDTSTINYLIGATIAEIAGLLTMIITGSIRNKGS